MSQVAKCNACGHEQELSRSEPSNCSACAKPIAAAVEEAAVFKVTAADVVKPDPGVFRVSASDVIKPAQPAQPALPRAKTFQELGLDRFCKAVEDELSKDEKIVWLGCPSKNPDVHPPTPKLTLMIIAGVVICVAVALPVLFKGIPFIFPLAFGLFGLLFGAVALAPQRTSGYMACYVVTNRRVMIGEYGLLGLRRADQISSMKEVRTKSYYPHELLALERKNNSRVSGAGDLIFEYVFAIGANSGMSPGASGITQGGVPQRTPRGFFYLDRVSEVEKIIRSTLVDNLEKKMGI